MAGLLRLVGLGVYGKVKTQMKLLTDWLQPKLQKLIKHDAMLSKFSLVGEIAILDHFGTLWQIKLFF